VFYQQRDVLECGVIAVKIAPFCSERESILREALCAASSGSPKVNVCMRECGALA